MNADKFRKWSNNPNKISDMRGKNKVEKIILGGIFMLREYMLSLGYTDKEIDMIVSSPRIYVYRGETLRRKIKDIYGFLVDYGYDGRDVIKITTSIPQILCLSVTSIADRLDNMVRLSYTKQQVIRMTKRSPVILCLGKDNLDKKIKDMLELGYSHMEIMKMTSSFPSIFSFSTDSMIEKMRTMETLGFSPADVIQMTVSLPTLFGYNTDSIREKKKFYDSIGISEVMVKQPKQIMQSVELSYARYMFYKSNNVQIDMSNCHLIFEGQKRFFQENGITKEELLQLYSYDEYLKEQGKVRNRIKKK